VRRRRRRSKPLLKAMPTFPQQVFACLLQMMLCVSDDLDEWQNKWMTRRGTMRIHNSKWPQRRSVALLRRWALRRYRIQNTLFSLVAEYMEKADWKADNAA
jgi:hypothetical protein